MLFYVIGWYLMHCMYIANLPAVLCDGYINAQMFFIMLNEILLGSLMIIIEYLMIILILMKLIVLHIDYYMLYGEEWRWNGYLPCTVMWCMLFMDVLMWINAVFNVTQWFISVTLINPHNPIYCKLFWYLTSIFWYIDTISLNNPWLTGTRKVSGNIPSVPGANTEMYSLHYETWHHHLMLKWYHAFLAGMYVYVPGKLSRYPHSNRDAKADALILPLWSWKLWWPGTYKDIYNCKHVLQMHTF